MKPTISILARLIQFNFGPSLIIRSDRVRTLCVAIITDEHDGQECWTTVFNLLLALFIIRLVVSCVMCPIMKSTSAVYRPLTGFVQGALTIGSACTVRLFGTWMEMPAYVLWAQWLLGIKCMHWAALIEYAKNMMENMHGHCTIYHPNNLEARAFDHHPTCLIIYRRRPWKLWRR